MLYHHISVIATWCSLTQNNTRPNMSENESNASASFLVPKKRVTLILWKCFDLALVVAHWKRGMENAIQSVCSNTYWCLQAAIMFIVFHFYLYNTNTGPNPILVRLCYKNKKLLCLVKSCFSLKDTPSLPQLLVMYSLFKLCDHTSTLTISSCVCKMEKSTVGFW